MDREKVHAYRVPIGLYVRSFPVEQEGPDVCLRVPVAWAAHVRGAIMALGSEGLFEGTEAQVREVEHLTTLMLEGEECCDPEEEWGADFQAPTPMLQAMQGEELPPPPWEFRVIVVDGAHVLQFRTAE